jgi:hypothetical protein
MNILDVNLNEIVYTTEDGERQYTAKQIIELAKGNVTYAQSLIDRVEWQGIETLIQDDLMCGEIVEFNDQYLMTGGVEIEINEI